MFNIVGENFSIDYCKQPDWYLKHSWTEEQQDKFKEWLVKYLYKNANKLDLIKNKEACRREASWFLLDYGWKFK